MKLPCYLMTGNGPWKDIHGSWRDSHDIRGMTPETAMRNRSYMKMKPADSRTLIVK